MASNKAVGRTLSVATLLVFLLIPYPYFHNHFVHPLGRLEKTISFGDDCEQIRRQLADYDLSSNSADRQVSDSVHHPRTSSPERGPETYSLFVYDLSLFDDLQLTVLCSSSTGAVLSKNFLAD